MMKRILSILLPLILVSACNRGNKFTIRGVINTGPKEYVYLNRVNVNTLVLIDSSKVKKDGRFSFRVDAKEPEFYQLGYSESDFITLLGTPGEKIQLEFNGKALYNNYNVKGSEGSEDVRMLDLRLAGTKRKLDSLKTVFETASREPDFDQKGPAIETEFRNTLKDIRKKNIEFIITHTKSMASLKALYQRIDENTYVLYEPRDLQYLKIISDSLGRYYPKSKQVQALAEDLKKEMNQFFSKRIEDMANSLPQTKLDPDLVDITGKRIALSSLKGKVVLLTFWSVQSQDCIAENLLFKNIYQTYNRKGFEIYQVNLDENEAAWRNEVKFDELPWISTREDDPKDPVNARLFNVRTLPANFLFGRDGSVIGTNLHGRALDIKLSQLFD